MKKKRILSVVLLLMITLCCIVEAVMIRGLRNDRTSLQGQIDSLSEKMEKADCKIVNIDEDVTEIIESKIPEVFLPLDIYVTAGLTVEIYNNTVIQGVNLDNYDVYWKCEVGDCMSDKYRLKALPERIGDYEIEMTVYDLNMKEIVSKEAVLHIVENVFLREDLSEISMLSIGDSMTMGGEWQSYIQGLSGDKISHVGTIEGQPGIYHEGQPGMTAADFINGCLYGEYNPTPLYNEEEEQIDFTYYKENTGISPDVVLLYLGTNGLKMDTTDNVNAIESIIDEIHQDDEDIQVLVVTPIYPSDQDGMARQQNVMGFQSLHGMWSLERCQMVYNLTIDLSNMVSKKENTTLVPASIMFDRDYGFAKGEMRIDPHTSVMKTVSSESIHPSTSGYNQIGDTIYSTLCYLESAGKIEKHTEETISD